MPRDTAQTFRIQPPNPNGLIAALDYTVTSTLEGKVAPERRWTVEGWIPDSQVTLLAGDGGVGKTLIAHQLLVACALGRDWLGMPVKPCKVFGLFCEDDEGELHRRQEAINRLYGCSFGDLEENMAWFSYVGGDASLADFSAYDPQEPTSFYHRLVESVHNFGAELVVIDSLHDVFAGNEINRVHARGFIRQLQDLAQGIDGAVVLNSHPSRAGRAEGSGESGSTAWRNAVRSHLYLSYPKDETDTDKRVLARKKSNYARINDEIPLEWRDGVLMPTYQATGVLKGMERRNADAAFMDAIKALNARGQHVNTSPNTKSYAPRFMARSRMSQVAGFYERDLEQAMNRLFDVNRIVVREDGPPSKRRSFIDEAKGGPL